LLLPVPGGQSESRSGKNKCAGKEVSFRLNPGPEPRRSEAECEG
jgi:hypothetical protein